MTATNQQPVAEICSASHDDAQFGERAIKPLCDISGMEYGTPLYAGAAPAAVAGPAWDKTRDALATLLLGLARRPFLDFDVACIALDAATEPGMPLAYMRGAPAAPALEAPAAQAVPPGFALVPMRLTRAMKEVLEEEGWQWEDLLAAACAITESDHTAISRGEPSDGEIQESFGAYGAEFTDKHLKAVREIVGNALAAAPQAQASAPDWWRKHADEIEAQVAATGSSEAMRCYTDMRTLLQAAAAPQAPAALDELRQIADIAACWGCDHPDEPGDTELLRRVKWAARQLRAAAQAPAAPADPMDWPLPCDVTVGHGTIRKGCKLRTLVLRMQVLYDLSQKVELAAPAAPSIPQWIDDPQDIEQGQMLNPAWVQAQAAAQGASES